MNSRLVLTLVVVLLLPFRSYAQSPDFIPLKEGELVGYWQVMEVPDGKQTGKYKNADMYNGEPCNVQIFKDNGTYATVSVRTGPVLEANKRQCEARREMVELSIVATQAFSSPAKWRALTPDKQGMFLTEFQSKGATVGLAWAASRISRDLPTTNALGFNLKKGDIVMDLLPPPKQNERPVSLFKKVLRPIAE